MENIGIDVHKRESQICIITETGEVLERRIATRRDRFAELLAGRPPAQILIESSTESEWVAAHVNHGPSILTGQISMVRSRVGEDCA